MSGFAGSAGLTPNLFRHSIQMSCRRALLELAAAYTLILLVIWTPNPFQRIFYIAAVIVLAAILATSFESCDKLGLRRTNLGRSLWIAIAAILLCAFVIIIAVHLHSLHAAPTTVSGFIARYWGYALWAFVQQLLLLDVFLRRLLILTPSPRIAMFATAAIFALAHLPNPVLTPLSFIWGLICCAIFLHYRNIIPLAIAHAILGITLAITVPSPIIRNMRVGLGFLRYGHHHYRAELTRISKLASRNSHLETRSPPPSQDADNHHRSHIPHNVSTSVCVTADAPTRLSWRHARP